jgi:hypothetical protein
MGGREYMKAEQSLEKPIYSVLALQLGLLEALYAMISHSWNVSSTAERISRRRSTTWRDEPLMIRSELPPITLYFFIARN